MKIELTYLMPAGFGEAELIEKRSRFIARVWPVHSDKEALEHIAQVRTQHRDATHNVFAYLLRSGQMRCSDDGEPQGTSGVPTLNVFQNELIVDVCCVITRYYGGTLLGAGGLVRAYSRAAKAALDAAGINQMRQWNIVHIVCPYSLFERMKVFIHEHQGLLETSDFGAEIDLVVLVPTEQTPLFIQQVQDASAGTVTAAITDTVFRGALIR